MSGRGLFRFLLRFKLRRPLHYHKTETFTGSLADFLNIYELNTKARTAHLGLCQQQNLMTAANCSYGQRSFLQSSYPQGNIGLAILEVLNKRPKTFFSLFY